MDSNTYFANKPIDEIGKDLVAEVEKNYRYLLGSGMYTKLWDSHLNYHGVSPRANSSSHAINRGGRNSQLAMMKVNHFRNLGQHLLQLTTSQRPAPQPIATNSDAKSQEQVVVAKGILEYYSREKRIDRILRSAAEHAIVYSEGYVLIEWNARRGDTIGKNDNGIDIKNGDVEVSNILPTDIIKDPTKDSYQELDWMIARRWKNKFETASRYALNPVDAINGNNDADEVVASILASDTKTFFDRTRLSMVASAFGSAPLESSGEIPVYEFYHKLSDAVPKGRKVVFLQDGTVLYDGPLGVNGIPIRRICPGDLIGSPYGYTPMFDLLGIQEAIDALYSAIVTNQMTFGVQMIMAMKGSDIDFKQLSRGLSFIEYATPDNKPEALNLTHTPAEIFKFIAQLEGAMETLSGVNSTVRGSPEASLKSGSALALVQSQAIQFSSGLQMSYAQLIEDVYTDMLNCFKAYANDTKTITIVGKYNRAMVKSFTKESISNINRVIVESGSALSQTIGGRTQIAQDLLKSGLIKKPEEYMSVINTGKLDPMLEGDLAELINIKAENEALADGINVTALAIDPHSLHIREHRAVVASPEARNNPAIVEAMNEHITQHVMHLSDPALANLLIVLGEKPLQMAMAPPGQDGGQPSPGIPPQGGMGLANDPESSGVSSFPDMAAPDADPMYPTNPQTGQKWNPVDGGVSGIQAPPMTQKY